jgi:hypothetical protein
MGQSSSANLEFLICNFQFLSGNQVAKATTATKDEGFSVEIASLYIWKALAAARKGVHRKMEARASKGGRTQRGSAKRYKPKHLCFIENK